MSERSPRKIQPKIRKPRGKANPKARKVKKPSRVDESKKNEVIELPKRTGNGKKCHLINHSQNPMGLIDSLEIVDDLNELTECLHQRSTLMIPLTNEETMHCARIILNTDQDDYSHLGIIKAAMMFIKMTTKI
ncbi:Hypothetical protein POVR1_LOCUS181 [uncultured virus]|nr:Hypothetical protein POVR1_LOCUS181 [uncultured virus]